ncbi:MAG: hypothetical protein LQ347_002310 [Umbilicaria vellea]|nr:MAG: hypothetical protein LQ347_002310 [Umbilicaria vellea]
MADSSIPDAPKSTAEALQDALNKYDRLFRIHDSRIFAYIEAHDEVHRSTVALYQLDRGPPIFSPDFPWLHENSRRYTLHLRTSAGKQMKQVREEIAELEKQLAAEV